MNKDPIITGRLFGAFLNGTISSEDRDRLEKLPEEDESARKQFELYLNGYPYREKDLKLLSKFNSTIAWDNVVTKTNRLKRRHILIKWAVGIAACLMICLTLYIKTSNVNNERIVEDHLYGFKNDVLPGVEQAELILADGKVIKLGNNTDSMLDLTRQLVENGRLREEELMIKNGNQVPLYHTLRVPAAGSYRVQLEDGTKIRLNASSSLCYPVRFSQNSREVKLSGEAYFEVAHNSRSPFIVSTEHGKIKVLGTVFNVNSYNKDNSIVALLNGSVRIENDQDSKVLVPGELAIIQKNKIQSAHVDLEKYVAWNSDYFYFSDDKITSIMEQLSRWYGVKIYYRGEISNKTIGGSINRKVSLAEALDMLERVSNLKFEIDGENVTVIYKP